MHKLKPQLLMDRDGGPTVWLVQHDHQALWLGHRYRLGCPNCGPEKERAGIVFDVREVPGYTEYQKITEAVRGVDAAHFMDRLIAHNAAERRHHAEIIARAFEAGWYPVLNGDDG
jgi:hypothetical protein